MVVSDRAIYIDKPEVGYPIADPFPTNPKTGEPWDDWEVEEIQWLLDMTRGLILIVGEVGTGKSLFMAWLGWKLKKYFGQPVVADFPFKPAFGEYLYLPKKNFVDELKKMEEITDRSREIGAEQAFLEGDSRFYKAVVLLDESHTELNKRKGGNNLAILITETFTLWRHYQCLFVVASPKWNLLERIRFDDFITHEIGARFNEAKGQCQYSIYVRKYHAHKRLTLTVADWTDIWESYCPVAPSVNVMQSVMDKELKEERRREQAKKTLEKELEQ